MGDLCGGGPALWLHALGARPEAVLASDLDLGVLTAYVAGLDGFRAHRSTSAR